MRRPLVRVVPNAETSSQSYTLPLKEVPAAAEDRHEHSLHGLIPLRTHSRPSLASFLIEKLSSHGDTVLDPFSGSGIVPLEASLLGRKVLASDSEEFFTCLTRAKLEPVDIAEVALFLQLTDFRRPVALDSYAKGFNSYFDTDTFRELVCLRAELRQHTSRTARFISAATLGLLHGSTVGYLSAYSSPYESVAPDAQFRMNRERGAGPSYRAVASRVLRKVAHLSRDCRPSLLTRSLDPRRVVTANPRSLSFIETGQVDLVCTAFPSPFSQDRLRNQWLRLWFAGETRREQSSVAFPYLDDWKEFSGEVLFELARVTKRGGACALILRDSKKGPITTGTDQHLSELVQEAFSEFWRVDQVVLSRGRAPRLRDATKSRPGSNEVKILILRRT